MDKQEKINSVVEALKNLLEEQDLGLDNISHIKFKHPISGKGILWSGQDYTKQFVYQENSQNIFSSENIDVSKDKSYKINDEVVLSQTELGSTVTKSNVREVGRLKGLVVDGSLSVNNYLIYDSNTDRLGIGTEEPNAALSIVDESVELIFGAADYDKGSIGTFNNKELQ